MVDLGGYVIILVETKDKKIKLYGECAEKFLLLMFMNVFKCFYSIYTRFRYITLLNSTKCKD
jgi:hypothetical protein